MSDSPDTQRRIHATRAAGGVAAVAVIVAFFAAVSGGGDGEQRRDASAPVLERPGVAATDTFAKGARSKAKPASGAGASAAGKSGGKAAPEPGSHQGGEGGGGGGGRSHPPVRPLGPEAKADIAAVKAALEELVARTNARDPGVCTELMTQRHVEEATGLSGSAAVARCRRDVKRSTATVRLNRIYGVRIEGDSGLIQFASSVGELAKHQVLRVARAGGRWKFDGDGTDEV